MRWTSIVLVAACGLWAAPVEAQVQQVLPYSGYLDQGGMAVSDVGLRMRFVLFNTPEPVDGEQPLWAEERPVNVRNGRFGVALGDPRGAPFAEAEGGPMLPRPPIGELVSRNEPLFLQLRIAGEGDPPVFVTLSGRQHIVPAPQALWTAPTDLVLDTLRVDGPIDARGGITNGAGPLTMGPAVAVEGQLDAQSLFSPSITATALAVDTPLDARGGITSETGTVVVDRTLQVDGALNALSMRTDFLSVTEIEAGRVTVGNRPVTQPFVDGFYCVAGGDAPVEGPTRDTHACFLYRSEAGCRIEVERTAGWRLVSTGNRCEMACVRLRPDFDFRPPQQDLGRQCD